jgi:hypothetical protein
MKIFYRPTILILTALLASCSNQSSKNEAPKSDAQSSANAAPKSDDPSIARAIGVFEKNSVSIAPGLVPCTLSGGTKTECMSIKVVANQAGHELGPWCPRTIQDDADKSGFWMEGGTVHDVDGKFIENLSVFYKDNAWQLFDKATGKVKVTSSKEACLAAARPDVDAKFNNYCVECQTAYFNELSEITYLIPAQPVMTTTTQQAGGRNGIGISLHGILFDAPAPTQAILAAHTIAPMDDCGGHVNPHVGYHYHAITNCTKEAPSAEGHAPMIGYAFDGHKLYTQLNNDGAEPSDLDACRGHEFGDLGYHYHANAPGKNQIIGCFKAERGCAVRDGNNDCKASNDRPPPPRAKAG